MTDNGYMPVWNALPSVRVNKPETNPDDDDWCSGLFVGEGCLSAYARKGVMGLYLQIGMYDQRAIERFARFAAWHAGRIHKGSRTGDESINVRCYVHEDGMRRAFHVRLTGRRAANVAKVVLQRSGDTLKAEQIKEALAVCGY